MNIDKTVDKRAAEGVFSPTAIVLRGDGEPLDNTAYIEKLSSLSSRSPIAQDNYSIGGSVAELEESMARVLGKESAVFMPTGTLANHLAVRKLCQGYSRVIVQEQGHLYRDSGDTIQQLSGINLVPLGVGNPCFTYKEVQRAIEDSLSGRVPTQIGALVIESPVRRCHGQVMPFKEMQRITQLCQENSIGTHLDGARLFMMSAASGINPEEYSSLFDTVYVSMWKYFGSPFGAILAGTNECCENLYKQRRMFGGGLPSASMAAALALEGSKSFQIQFDDAMKRGVELLSRLSEIPEVQWEPYPNGSNIFPVSFSRKVDINALSGALEKRGIFINHETDGINRIHVTVNVTLLRKSVDQILHDFSKALEESLASS